MPDSTSVLPEATGHSRATTPVLLNAAALYTAAFLLTVLVHELGHAGLSWALGGRPVLYNTYVDSTTPNLPTRAELAIALAGPVVSLLQGIAFLAVARRPAWNSAGALLALYLGAFGLINFFGYVMTGPFFSYGDLGKALRLLATPGWLIWTLAAAATLVIYLLIARTGPLFLRFVPASFIEEGKRGRGKFLRALLLWPWLLGSLLILALSWPAPTFLSTLYPPLSSMVLGAAYGAAMNAPVAAAPAESGLQRWQLPAFLALVLLAAAFRWLSQGVAF